MIDYISIELDASMKDVLFNNDLLDFVSDVSNKTGELNPNNSTFIQSAQYNGLTFYIVQYKNMMTKPKVSLKGSIHKYWQHGTNYMDFNFESLKQATNQLQDLFHIDWNKSVVHSFEYGLNIQLPFSCRQMIDDIVSHQGTIPNECRYHGKGQLYNFIKSQHRLKVYNKGLQSYTSGFVPNDNDDLIRLEHHVDKMQFVRRKGVDIHSVNDILSIVNLKRLGDVLLESYDKLVIVDHSLSYKPLKPKELIFVNECKNPRYWNKISKIKNTKKYARTLKKLSKISHTYQSNINQDILRNLIKNKIEELLKIVPYLPTLENPDLSDIYPYIVGNKQTIDKRFCEVTRLDISHQSKGSLFLSEKSIGRIEETNPILYQKLSQKYLPKNTTQNHNYYIAHNIRNDKFNFIRRYDRAVQQTSLFNISEVIRLTDTQRAYLNLY